MNLWTVAALLGIGFGLEAERLAAQQDSGGTAVTHVATASNSRLAQAMPASYTEPSCFSATGQRKVSRGIASLKTALESTTPQARMQALQEGEQSVVEVIQKEKQDRNAAAWYTLAQIYLYQDNASGADSTLKRAGQLAPGCKSIVEDLRYTAWAALMNGAIEFSKGEGKDSALVLFRKAAAIYPEKPHAALNAGIIFANSGQTDSAIVYFQKAADLADHAQMTEERNRATFNLAAMLQQASRHAEAVQALEKYIAWVPENKEAKGALATSYRAVGQAEKAQELEKQLFAASGMSDSSASSKDVKGGAPVGPAMAMRVGVNFYNEKKYADAAAAFAKVIEAEPNNRDAIYNLANTYLALKDGAKLVETGLRLMQIEPMSESTLQLLGSGYRIVNDIDKAVKIAEQLLALPTDISVKEFATRADGAKLKMTAVGRAAQTPAGKSILAVASTLIFEFLDATGTVVTTQEAAVPALKPDQSNEFEVDAKGRGITGWRYTQKS